MVTRTLTPSLMLILLLGVLSGLPSLVSAGCCPCSLYPSCQNWCQCRGTPGCSSCRLGGTDIFQQHAVAIAPSSNFDTTHRSLSPLLALPLIDTSSERFTLTVNQPRTIGDFGSRIMAGKEFRIRTWCPGSLGKSA